NAPAKPVAGCKTVVTREEFEELINAIDPRMPKADRRELAKNYGKMLTLSQQALREGLEKKPGVQALIQYVRTSALGGAAYKKLFRESNDLPLGAVDKYYAANKANFERFNF